MTTHFPFLSQWSAWLNDAPRHRLGVRILQIAIGSMLCFRVCTEVRFANYFWGPHGLGSSPKRFLLGRLGELLDQAYTTDAGTLAVICVLFLCAAGLVLDVWTRWCTLLALLLISSLEARLPQLLDGGDNITRLCLGYMLFLLPSKASYKKGSLAVYLHNLAVVAITTQLMVMYLTAGLMKASGQRWTQGTALYLVSQVDWFSLPRTRWMFTNPYITTLAAYGTIFFQVWFPVAIFSKMKPLWILGGISLHLGIGYFMGLVGFSTVMIGLELLLLSDEELQKVASFARRIVGLGARSTLPRRLRSRSQLAFSQTRD